MILTFKFLLVLQLWSDINVTILDKFDQKPIPYAEINLCGTTYKANENGTVNIGVAEGVCEFSSSAFGYETAKGWIAINGKQSIVFQLEPKFLEMENFTVEGKRINLQNGKELVEVAINNFKETHINSFDQLIIHDSITFSLGKEEFFQESKTFSSSSKKPALNELSAKRNTPDIETYKELDNLIRGPFGGPINQKLREYTVNRTDLILNQDCDFFKSLDCYFSTFYSTNRAIKFNPFFFIPNRSQKLDHYGFFNKDFIDSHDFRFIGVDTLNRNPAFIVQVTSNRKSKPISLGGQEISDWYKPAGTIWIDQEDLALVKMVYRYEFNSSPKIFNASADKAEYESGPVYFENILEFKKMGRSYIPIRQIITEKDRNLRVFYNDSFFESVYVQHFLKFFEH